MNPSFRATQGGQHLREIEAPEDATQDLTEVRHPDGFEWAWLLWDNRPRLWRWTIRALVIATIVAFLIPKQYEATTRLMPPDQSNPGMAMLAALGGKVSGSSGSVGGSAGPGGVSSLGMLAGDMLGLKSSDAVLIGVLRSDTLEDRLIRRFDLKKVYWDHYMSDARKDLERFTEIAEDRKSGILTITVTDRSPQRAAALGQAYVEELDKLVAELSTSAARRERMFIEQRLKTVKQDLDSAARDFSEYASKNTAIDITAQGKAMVESAAVLQGQLMATQSELQGLKQIYTSNNVRVRSLQARVDELKHQLEKLGGDGSPLRPQDTSGDGVLNADEMYPSIRKLPLLGVRWADLYRQTKIEETVFELLTQKYELAKIEEAKEIPTIKILDVANVPEKKSSPHRLLVILGLTAAGFIGGAFWILGESRWHNVEARNPKKLLVLTVHEHLRSRMKFYLNRMRAYRTKTLRFSSSDSKDQRL